MFYGVDIGGTKTEIVAFDKEMQVCWRKRVATPVQDYELFLSTFTSLIDTADWARLGDRNARKNWHRHARSYGQTYRKTTVI